MNESTEKQSWYCQESNLKWSQASRKLSSHTLPLNTQGTLQWKSPCLAEAIHIYWWSGCKLQKAQLQCSHFLRCGFEARHAIRAKLLATRESYSNFLRYVPSPWHSLATQICSPGLDQNIYCKASKEKPLPLLRLFKRMFIVSSKASSRNIFRNYSPTKWRMMFTT